MIDPKIKDDVILLLYEKKGTAEIARTLGIEQNYVVAAIGEIKDKFPGGFLEYGPGYGDDIKGVSLHPKDEEKMFIFVKTGGFQVEFEKHQDSVKQENYKNELEISHLKLAIRAAQEAKSSRNAAWISALAAIVAAIAALIALFK